MFCLSLLWVLQNINFTIHSSHSLFFLQPHLFDPSNGTNITFCSTLLIKGTCGGLQCPQKYPFPPHWSCLKLLPERTYIQHIRAQITLMPREVLSMTLVHSVLSMGDLGQAASLTKWGEKAIVCWAFENAKESKPPYSSCIMQKKVSKRFLKRKVSNDGMTKLLTGCLAHRKHWKHWIENHRPSTIQN